MECERWMPTDLPLADKQAAVAAATRTAADGSTTVDCYRAAGLAWESYAAQLWASTEAGGGTSGVQSVSTGQQSVTYSGDGFGTDAAADAMRKAKWYFSRARPYASPVGELTPYEGDERGGWTPLPGWESAR